MNTKSNPINCHGRQAKLATANQVLQTFAKKCSISLDGGRVKVHFPYCGEMLIRQWMCRGQDFYPVWNRYWPFGGITALSQLVRWVQGKPVLPISTWRHWASEACKLLPSDAVETLLAGGYPEHCECVLCGNPINGSLDWWSISGVSGPCCGWRYGCRQRSV